MLLIVFGQGFLASANSAADNAEAERLNERGYSWEQQGNPSAALKSWEAAYKLFKKLNAYEKMTETLINQGTAHEAGGDFPEACEAYSHALKLEKDYERSWICSSRQEVSELTNEKQQQKLNEIIQKELPYPSEIQVTGLRYLGNILRKLNKLELSELVLKKDVEFSRLKKSELSNLVLLSLANVENTFYKQAKNKSELTEEPLAKEEEKKLAQSKFKIAKELYQKIKQKNDLAALQAKINLLSLFLEQRKSSIPGTVDETEVKNLIGQIVNDDFDKFSDIESVYARLHFATDLTKIYEEDKKLLVISQEPGGVNTLAPPDSLLSIALNFANTSLELSKKLYSQRGKSSSLGAIANVYRLLGDIPKQKEFLIAAAQTGEAEGASSIAYKWEQQLGRLYKLRGEIDKATKAYSRAIANIEQVQWNLLPINSEVQFSFKEKAEPIYKEYIELLLSQSRPNLGQAIQGYEKFKLAELEDFLQCGKIPQVSLSKTPGIPIAPPTIYLINLGQRVEVVVRDKKGTLYHHTPNTKSVLDDTNTLITLAQSSGFVEVPKEKIIEHSKNLYQELVAPIKKYLPESGTLVFILDNYFQNLPLAMLHDGKDYLIKSYNISIALGSRAWEPKILKKGQLKVLIGGVSEQNRRFYDPLIPKNFSSLPEVKTEIALVKANSNSHLELLNAEFTGERFSQKLKDSNLPVVHITTHGQFSSDPQKTFILMWDKAVNVRQLNELLRQSQIELLILSACQTAKGDRRAGLGIAGVAVQSGARSTLASLWLIDAQSTSTLMGEFYKGLKNGLYKAEALRKAQLALLSNPKYQHPANWAGFVLVGSYL